MFSVFEQYNIETKKVNRLKKEKTKKVRHLHRLHQAIEQQGLPFQVKKSRPNRETLAAMKEALELEKTGGGKRFKSIDELRKDLLS